MTAPAIIKAGSLGSSLGIAPAHSPNLCACASRSYYVIGQCCAVIGRNGSREQICGVPILMSHVLQDNSPLSFLRSDWLRPFQAIGTTLAKRQICVHVTDILAFHRPALAKFRRHSCLRSSGSEIGHFPVLVHVMLYSF